MEAGAAAAATLLADPRTRAIPGTTSKQPPERGSHASFSRISSVLAIAALAAVVACHSSYSGYSDSGYSGSSTGVVARSEPVETSAPAPALAPVPPPGADGRRQSPPQDAEAASRPVELIAFATPEAAMIAVATAAEAGDHDRMTALFGHDCGDVVGSDDAPADGDDCVRVARMIREQVTFENVGERTVAVIGKDQWRFPVPLEKGDRGWQFDVDGGRDELDTREVGRNEILTVDTLEEIAEAQREYAAQKREPGSPRGTPRASRARRARMTASFGTRPKARRRARSVRSSPPRRSTRGLRTARSRSRSTGTSTRCSTAGIGPIRRRRKEPRVVRTAAARSRIPRSMAPPA